MQGPLNVDDLLKHSLLFLDFDDDDIALLARGSHVACVSRHGLAFRRSNYVGGFYAVVVGVIKLALPGAHGQCKVIKFSEPGEYFDEPFMLLNHPYAADMQAMEDSLLVRIGKRAIDDALHVYLRLAWQMLTGLSTRPHTLMRDIETVNLQSINERLVGYLLSLSCKSDCTRFPCSESLVASKLGLAPATLSRMSRQLIYDGLIRVEGREVVIRNTTMLQRQLMMGQQQKLDASQSPAVPGRCLNVLTASSTSAAAALNSSSLQSA